MELSSVIALILGVYGSIKFSDFTFTFFFKNFPELIKDINENYLKIASFVFTFLFIIVLISIVGKGITKVLKMVFLGFINKILGGCFGSFKFTLFISLFLVFLDSLNTSFNLVESSLLETSFFYDPIKEVGDKLIEFFNSNKESINFFN
jgi:membrane protein required for colicin V production